MKYKDLSWDWYPITHCRVCGLKARRVAFVSGGCGDPDLAVPVCGPNCGKKVEEDPRKYPGLKSQWG